MSEENQYQERSQDELKHIQERASEVIRIGSSSAVGAVIGAGSGIAASIVIGGASGSVLPGVGTVIGAVAAGAYSYLSARKLESTDKNKNSLTEN